MTGFDPVDIGKVEDSRTALILLLRQSLIALPGMLGAAVVVVTPIWLRHDNPTVWVWLALVGALLLYRRQTTRANLERLPHLDAPGLAKLERQQTIAVGATGALWGALVWLITPGDPYVDFFNASVSTGMVGAAGYSMSASRWAFPAYGSTTILPVAAMAVFVGSPIYLFGGIGTLLLLFMNLMFHRRAWHATMAMIRLTRENVELAAQLKVEKQAAEDASRIKSFFLAGVSHDLKHPLNALGLYLGYLKAKPTGTSQALPGMEQALTGMGTLLSRLLDLSRLESGDIKPQRRLARMNDLFRQSAVRFQASAADKQLRLHFVSTTASLDTDPEMLQSVLDNLVGNAVRYTSNGGVTVGLRWRQGQRMLEIIDTGPGIPADRIPLLFDAYRRFDDTQHGKDQGYGLGLALVKKQCQLLGYPIEVNSVPGRGSRFAVALRDIH